MDESKEWDNWRNMRNKWTEEEDIINKGVKIK